MINRIYRALNEPFVDRSGASGFRRVFLILPEIESDWLLGLIVVLAFTVTGAIGIHSAVIASLIGVFMTLARVAMSDESGRIVALSMA